MIAATTGSVMAAVSAVIACAEMTVDATNSAATAAAIVHDRVTFLGGSLLLHPLPQLHVKVVHARISNLGQSCTTISPLTAEIGRVRGRTIWVVS